MNTAGAMKLRRKWIQVWHALRLGLGPIAMLCGILSFPEFSFFRFRCEVRYRPKYSMHGERSPFSSWSEIRRLKHGRLSKLISFPPCNSNELHPRCSCGASRRTCPSAMAPGVFSKLEPAQRRSRFPFETCPGECNVEGDPAPGQSWHPPPLCN